MQRFGAGTESNLPAPSVTQIAIKEASKLAQVAPSVITSVKLARNVCNGTSLMAHALVLSPPKVNLGNWGSRKIASRTGTEALL